MVSLWEVTGGTVNEKTGSGASRLLVAEFARIPSRGRRNAGEFRGSRVAGGILANSATAE
jgi:hypothetical protein